MPESEIRKRGGAKRWRTVSLGNGEYMHCAVVKEPGKRGGMTVCGEVRRRIRT